MRFTETDGEKERLVFVSLQILNGASGDNVVALRLTFALKNDDAIRFRLPGVLGTARRRSFRLIRRRRACCDSARRAVCDRGIHRFSALGPGYLIVDASVENLARPQRRVAVLPKMLWQCHVVRVPGPKVSVVIHYPGLGRIATVEQRRARRIAQGELGIGAIETHASGRQSVNVRRFDYPIAISA